MEKPVEHDPQQYSEEWFNVAVLLGKEFELPNISNPSFIDKITNLTVPQKQPSCNNVVARNTFDLNHSIEPTDHDEQTNHNWTNHFVPCKKPRRESNNESNSVQEREIPVDLNKIAPEFDIEDGEYKCFKCNASFINGNALGGHMSSHAKQSKREAITGRNVFKPGSLSGFGESSNVFPDVSDMFVVESTGNDESADEDQKSTHSDSEL